MRAARACLMGRTRRPRPRWHAPYDRPLARESVTLPRALAFTLTPADGGHVALPSRRPHPGRSLAGACPGNPSP
jgi:hypothetical protein